MSRGADSLLDAWSRRRARVAEEERRLAREAARREAEARRARLEQIDEEAALAELGLAPPETLQPGDDFGAYLREIVPEPIRRRALRRLWRLRPELANLDGLNDYDEDFTGAGAIGGLVATAWQVGKGYAKRLAAVEEATPDGGAPIEPEASAPAVTAAAEADEPPAAQASGPVATAEAPAPRAAEPVRRPRFMRFRIAGADGGREEGASHGG